MNIQDCAVHNEGKSTLRIHKMKLLSKMNIYLLLKILLLLIIIVLNSKVCCHNDANLIKQFLSTERYKNLAIYGTPSNDEFYEDLLAMAKDQKRHISSMPIFKLVDTHDTLEIFYEPYLEDVRKLLNQPGIQFELSTNTWLIFSSITFDEVKTLFNWMKFKVGLNANIFFVLKSNDKTTLVQVLGSGAFEVEIVVSFQKIHKVYPYLGI